jgi:hypothetical protein
MTQWDCQMPWRLTEGLRCTHPECEPEEEVRHAMKREKSEVSTPKGVERAAQFLVEATERIDALNIEIGENDLKQKELGTLQVKMHEEIADLRRKASEAIAMVAASFGHTQTYSHDPEESHG